MKKINVAKLLKDCPKGMELDCTLFEGVVFHDIVNRHFPIRIRREQGGLIELTANGCIKDKIDAKCVIFPKGKTTWEGFQRPFKVGDIVLYEGPLTKGIMIIGSFDYGDGTKPEAARAKIGDSIYIKTGNSTIYSGFVPGINNIRHATDDEVIDFVNKEGCQEYLNFYKDWLLNHCSRLVSLGLLLN